MSIVKTFEKIGYKLGQQKHLISLRDGITLTMPLILAGSIFIIITSLPIPGWEEMVNNLGIAPWFDRITRSSFGIMALIAVFGIAKSLAEKYNVDGVSAGVIALSSYILLIPTITGDELSIGFSNLGSKGLFVAIVVGLITAEIFRIFIQKNITIRMPDGVPPAVSKSFSALIPGTLILLFWGVVFVLVNKLGYSSIFEMIFRLISEPLTFITTGIIGTLLAVMFNSLFWAIGIHGGQMVSSIMGPIWLTASDQNRIALEAGKELPHIVTSTFMDSLVWMGGGGTTIGLAIILFIYAKSKQNKMLGKLSFAPGLFNINEPILFGLPVVMNFKIMIPFILAPMVTTIITYYSIYFGLVAKTTGVIIPWATPPIISGYLVTGGHISGAVIQIITIIISILIYLPFFISIDNDILKLEELNEGK